MAARHEANREPGLEEALGDEQTPLLRRDSVSSATASVPVSLKRGAVILLAMGATIFIQGFYRITPCNS
jgi:hypothetical protein